MMKSGGDDMFSERLKTLRKEKHKTQQDMADFLQIRRSTYGEYERGRITPPYDKIKKLADYLDVSIDYLMGTSNFKTNEEKFGVSESRFDVSKEIRLILDELQNDQKSLMFYGKVLDDESRELLKASLENSIQMALLLSKNK